MTQLITDKNAHCQVDELPGLANLNEPLRQLLKGENDWVWEGPQ